MNEAARQLLILAIGGAVVTALGSTAIWLGDPPRRMRRALKRVLSVSPEIMLLSPYNGRAAGLSFANETLAVCWNQGA